MEQQHMEIMSLFYRRWLTFPKSFLASKLSTFAELLTKMMIAK